MEPLIRWWLGVRARGRLSTGNRWAAVPGRRAAAFKARHPGALDALSLAHVTRGLVARYPETRDFAERVLAEARALERVHPGSVVFVFTEFKLHAEE